MIGKKIGHAEWCIMGSKYTMLFESYEQFHLLTTDGRMDSYSDYNAHLWVMQYC